MDLRTNIKLVIILAKAPKLLIFLFSCILLLIIGYYSAYINNSLPWLLVVLQNPIVTTLIGTVIGGAMAFYGSVYVQRNEVKSTAAIRRRDEIYVPLYNELLGFRKSLQEHPCPYSFVLSNRDKNPNSPEFLIWNSFKDDSRKLLVPKNLSNSLDKFLSIMNCYAIAREVARNDKRADTVIRNIIVTNSVQDNSKREDLISHYLPCNQNLSEIKKILQFDTSNLEGNRLVRVKSDDEIEAIAQEIYQECSKIDSIKELQRNRQLLDCMCNELIDALEIIIRYTNEKFEQNAKWF